MHGEPGGEGNGPREAAAPEAAGRAGAENGRAQAPQATPASRPPVGIYAKLSESGKKQNKTKHKAVIPPKPHHELGCH